MSHTKAHEWWSSLPTGSWDELNCRITEDPTGSGRGQVLAVDYPAHTFGTKVQAYIPVPGGPYSELYLAYDVRWTGQADYGRGGKLPGLMSAPMDASAATDFWTGSGYPDGSDGFGARHMFRALMPDYPARVEVLLQYMHQNLPWGDDIFHDDFDPPNVEQFGRGGDGVWTTVMEGIRINSTGESMDGFVKGWIKHGHDGTERESLNMLGVQLLSDVSVGIGWLCITFFYGGSTADWGPESDQTVLFDNFRVAETKFAL
jgi:hypothetical protein